MQMRSPLGEITEDQLGSYIYHVGSTHWNENRGKFRKKKNTAITKITE
jgi:hypothetical protein